MFYDPGLLDALEALPPVVWEGEVWRCVLGDAPPTRANTRGARWNPPEVAAIYTSLEEEVATRELEHLLSLQPIRPKVAIRSVRIRVALHSVIDLREKSTLLAVGFDPQLISSDDHRHCQEVGGAVAWLRNDGLLVQSARAEGSNLVIYDHNKSPEGNLEVIESKLIQL